MPRWFVYFIGVIKLASHRICSSIINSSPSAAAADAHLKWWRGTSAHQLDKYLLHVNFNLLVCWLFIIYDIYLFKTVCRWKWFCCHRLESQQGRLDCMGCMRSSVQGRRIILHFIHSLLLDVIDMKQELREMTDMIFIPFYVLIFAKMVRVALLLYSEGYKRYLALYLKLIVSWSVG